MLAYFSLRNFVFLAGFLHFMNIPGMIAAPKMLGWKEDLAQIKPINKNIFVVLCGGIMITIIGTGILVMLNCEALLDGTRLAASMTFFLSILWLYRFLIQVILYTRIWPSGGIARVSHLGLVFLFAFLTSTYVAAFVANYKGVSNPAMIRLKN